jgi:serine/threonine protein kinase
MCKDEELCQAWISLDSIGIQAQGCLKDVNWFNSLVIPCNQSIFNPFLYIDLPDEKLVFTKNVAHGKFGYIDSASYKVSQKQLDVYVKRPIIPGKSLLYEVCIQKLVGDSLSSIGFPTATPNVMKVFKLRDNSICFAMEQITSAITLDRYLDSLDSSTISFVIIDCLFQLCAMLWHLDNMLGINHRDLKPSNFLILEHDVPIRKVIQIENEILEIKSKYSLTFIDFGFSCLGSTDTQISDISLSTVYSRSDPCPKNGRDMYLFLAFLYIDFNNKLPSRLLSLFEHWLEVPGSNLVQFMKKDKENSKKWLYFVVGNDKIKKFNSCPLKIIKDLQALI